MMQIDISFPFAKVYDISRVDVVIGQGFTLLSNYADPAKWFSDNDPVLAITVKGPNAEVKTNAVGDSIILIMDDNFKILKELNIRVIDQPATDLGLNAEPAVQK